MRTQFEHPRMVPGGSVKVFLGDKGSRGPVCPQLWAASLGNALCVRFHGALGVTRRNVSHPGYEIYIHISKHRTWAGRHVCVRQTDTAGTESQLSAPLGGPGQGPAPTQASLSFICHMGVWVGMRLNSTEPFPSVIFATRISCDGENIPCCPM